MKMLYSVQATGNGHISRAAQLIPIFQKYGEVDVFLSGSNSSLELQLPVKYRSKGVSLFYGNRGGLDFWKTLKNYNPYNVLNESRNLPVENYDLVINDFEHITAKACKIKSIPSIHFGHQASFSSPKVPRPKCKNLIGEAIFTYYAESSQYLGLHFKKYDNRILYPIIREKIRLCEPRNKGHITIYLPGFSIERIQAITQSFPSITFHVFSSSNRAAQQEKNIYFYPIDQDMFTKSLVECQGIITGAGFETPAEALYLRKKLMVIPIKNHYEQACNAVALQEMGVVVSRNLTRESIERWVDETNLELGICPNNIDETVEMIVTMRNRNIGELILN